MIGRAVAVVPTHLADVVAALGGELRGDPELSIDRLGSLDSARPGTLSFIANLAFRAKLAATQASCVILDPDLAAQTALPCAALVSPDPQLYFARLTRWWVARQRVAPAAGIHPSAVIAEGARVHAGASIGALACVESGARIGDGVVLAAHAYVGADAQVGPGTRLHAHAVLHEGCVVGARGILHSGAVIGADGFGYVPHEGRWEKIEQLGAVRIGDDVEIGANTCIDRGALDDTVIGDGVKLDNLIQIAHNVQIGAHTAAAGCVGIAGSTRIGAHCTLGGASMIVGHIELADHVHISAGTVVMRSIRQPGHYTGVFPIGDHGSWEKNAATLRQLHSLRDRLRALEKKIT